MKKAKKAFSLVIAMWLVLVTVLLAIVVLEYIIPFWRNVRWVENATVAYYQAYSWLENGLFFFSKRTWKEVIDDMTRPYGAWEKSTYWYTFSTTSSWVVLPAPWTWNSEYDHNRNSISMWDSIQLEVWYWFLSNLNNFNIQFKIPQVRSWVKTTLSGALTDWIINWQLSSVDQTINSLTWTLITKADVDNAKIIDITKREWRIFWVISAKNPTISTFYWTNCRTSRCVLRFSIINYITWKETKAPLPYLEWKISWANKIPLRYSIINSTWTAYWYSRTLTIKYPQDTVAEALDFVVFQ